MLKSNMLDYTQLINYPFKIGWFEGIWNGPTSGPFQMNGCRLIWRYLRTMAGKNWLHREVLCISTIERVLCTPFAGQNRLSNAKTTFSVTNGTK